LAGTNKLKIFNDPIYGFIGTPNELIFKLIEHPYFQRLRRISQMGLSYVVYPGAHHTRFHHALGCFHLMQRAIALLRSKGITLSKAEEEALLCAILLHDMGHGPFSHALEHILVPGKAHEAISLMFMQQLNKEFGGRLDLAIEIFSKEHPKQFLNQLVSSQLDIDRLDYLKRDSFYTGVSEGNINAERLISMLNVHNDELVVEAKGIYSVEKFLMARRFMYWQVYLHKASLAAEQMLIRVISRVRYLMQHGQAIPCSQPLKNFLDPSKEFSLDAFAQLDDIDIMAALKSWRNQGDFILLTLCTMLLDRSLLKIKIKDKPISAAALDRSREMVKKKFGITDEEASYLVFDGKLHQQAYDDLKDNIHILTKKGKLVDVAHASDHYNLKALSQQVVKYYACFPEDCV